MRRSALACLLLAACGPARPDPAASRYAVVTTIPDSDPLHREIELLVEFRRAELFHVASFAGNRANLQQWLRDRAPSDVAAVVRPEELAASAEALVDVLCRLDDDPFPDASVGWFLAADVDFLRRQIRTVRGVAAKVDSRLLNATSYRDGPRGESTERLDWADGLPLRRVSAAAEDVEWLAPRLKGDQLLLESAPPRGLKLEGSVVFSAVPGSANPFLPLLSEFLRAGAAGVFAPLGAARAGAAAREWAEAVESDAPLGETWRRSAELAVLSGEPPAARLLFGCPLLDPFTRPAVPAFRVLELSDRQLRLGLRPDAPRPVHARVPLPADLGGVGTGRLERRDGRSFLHVLVKDAGPEATLRLAD